VRGYIVLTIVCTSMKKFEAYPRRQIRLSDEVWLELKKEKIKFGKNWNSFIKQLVNRQNHKRDHEHIHKAD
jgi:hypothetical protein